MALLVYNYAELGKKRVNLHRVFHGIRLLRLIKIGCRETINFFCAYFKPRMAAHFLLISLLKEIRII